MRCKSEPQLQLCRAGEGPAGDNTRQTSRIHSNAARFCFGYAAWVMDYSGLVELAAKAREHAYAPYSKFRVGAALMAQSGNVYLGCNVENATYGATICAERAAVCAMAASGERKLIAIAVFSVATPPATPCGICRQVLAEFAEDAAVIVATPSVQTEFSLAKLLPERFALKDVP